MMQQQMGSGVRTNHLSASINGGDGEESATLRAVHQMSSNLMDCVAACGVSIGGAQYQKICMGVVSFRLLFCVSFSTYQWLCSRVRRLALQTVVLMSSMPGSVHTAGGAVVEVAAVFSNSS